jgi:hypothetical protein
MHGVVYEWKSNIHGRLHEWKAKHPLAGVCMEATHAWAGV